MILFKAQKKCKTLKENIVGGGRYERNNLRQCPEATQQKKLPGLDMNMNWQVPGKASPPGGPEQDAPLSKGALSGPWRCAP